MPGSAIGGFVSGMSPVGGGPTVTTSDDLVNLIVAALTGNTGAADRVFTPRDWPVSAGDMPILKVQAETERKSAMGHADIMFDCHATIVVDGRVTSKAAAGDAGANAVKAALATLQRQIEIAVINNDALTRTIEQYTQVNTSYVYSSDGKQHFGDLRMEFILQFYQQAEDFALAAENPLEQMAIYSDAVNVFDPRGTYANPPLNEIVPAAPRTTGPDGRSEASQFFTLP